MKSRFLLTCSALGLALIGGAAHAGMHSAYDAPQRSRYISVSVDEASLKKAEDFVSSMADKGIGFLGDTNLSKDKQKSEFQKLLNSSFDMNTIARFSLGRYWKNASEAQRDEYMSLFRKMIVDVYSSRFQEYNGQTLKIEGSRPEGKRDVLVQSVVSQSDGPDVRVDWRVRQQKSGSFKVVDVVVEGVSMALTQRSDFSSVIQRGGGNMDVLLAHLRKQ